MQLLQDRLATASDPHLLSWTVANVSVSGETSGEGLTRLPAELAQFHPQVLLIELGANDGLRGQSLAVMRDNLQKMVELGASAGARPVLMEMRIPDFHGSQYSAEFVASYAAVARRRGVPVVPFFLAPLVSDRARWFQADLIHPNAAAQPLLLDAAWPLLRDILSEPLPP